MNTDRHGHLVESTDYTDYSDFPEQIATETQRSLARPLGAATKPTRKKSRVRSGILQGDKELGVTLTLPLSRSRERESSAPSPREERVGVRRGVAGTGWVVRKHLRKNDDLARL
jgi:hypothetical protein